MQTCSYGESINGGDEDVELGEPKMSPLSSESCRDRTFSKP